MTTAHYARLLIIGRPGTRKTPFVLTWPNVLLFDCDRSAEPYTATHTFQHHATTDIDEIRTTIDALLKAQKLPKTIGIDGTTTLYKARCDKYADRYNTDAQRDMRAFIEYLLTLPCHVVLTALEKADYATPGTKLGKGDTAYTVKPTDTIALSYRADTDGSIETHAHTILRFIRDDNEQRYSIVALRDRYAKLTPWQTFDELSATDLIKLLPPAPPPQAKPAATALSHDTKQALQHLVDSYNTSTQPKHPLTIAALLRKYPDPQKAKTHLISAIQHADGTKASPINKAAASPQQAKLGMPAHLA